MAWFEKSEPKQNEKGIHILKSSSGYLRRLIKSVHIFKIMSVRFFTLGDGNYDMEKEKTGMFGTGIKFINMNSWL